MARLIRNMTKFLGLRTIVYKVPNLEEAKDWYTKAFKQRPYFDEPFYAGFSIGGYELGLLPYEDEMVVHGNGSFAYWGVDNIEDSLAHMIKIGATEHEKPMDVGGGAFVASVKDPWKNIIGLIYNPYFSLPD